MNRSVTFTRPELVRVQSRGWLLGKLGVAVLVVAGAVLVWGPLVTDRPHAMRLVGWLGWAADCWWHSSWLHLRDESIGGRQPCSGFVSRLQ